MWPIIGFAAFMAAVSWWLRRRDRDGYTDRDWSSSAARPGMRWFTDFGGTGIRQRPARS